MHLYCGLMIKFFRKARKHLILRQNLRRYLLYAIGEIALVVVGILIALSINNWNNSVAQRKSELQIYRNIKNQINDDKEVINKVIGYNEIYLNQYKLANEIIVQEDSTRIDTLKKIAINLFRYSDFNRNSNVYQAMVNSGELKLLQNSEIIEKLQSLEESFIYMNRLEENHFQFILRYVGPGILDNINFSTGEIVNSQELYSFIQQNLFLSFIDVMEEKNQIYQGTSNEIDVISALIDEELRR